LLFWAPSPWVWSWVLSCNVAALAWPRGNSSFRCLMYGLLILPVWNPLLDFRFDGGVVKSLILLM
jgi:hypothetical protein